MSNLTNKQEFSSKCLRLNDRLRELSLPTSEIKTSEIVVVGDQSQGKSSLIEGLLSINLPKGVNIQTRAPTEIRMKTVKPQQAEYGMISYAKVGYVPVSRKFKIDELESVLRQAQGELIDNDYDVTDVPIIVEIHSNVSDDITVIDLPGIVRVQEKGQSVDIRNKIVSMYEKYMQRPQTLIINVVSAMTDIKTSESLTMSNEFNPSSSRTLLVLTKIDQHREKGLKQIVNDAVNRLRINPGNLFLVRNRTQAEADEGLTMKEVRKHEDELFNSNEELMAISNAHKGISALNKRMADLQNTLILANFKLNKQHYIQVRDMYRKELATIRSPYQHSEHCAIDIANRVELMFNRATQHYLSNNEWDTTSETLFIDQLSDIKTVFMPFDGVEV